MNVFGDLTVTRAQILAHTNQKHPPVSIKGRIYHSLSFRLSGEITVETEQARFRSEPDSVTFVPAGQAYTSEVLESGRMLVIHFHTLPCPSPKSALVFRPANPDSLKSSFYLLLSRYQSCETFDHACMAILYDILADCHSETDGHSLIPERVRRIRQAINTRFSDSSLTVASLAEEAGVSEVYFRREFKRYYGVSPCEYLKQTRIKNAKLLLKTGFYAVTEVAMRTGFDSPSYFAKEFHRLTGQTPTDYIKKHEVP